MMRLLVFLLGAFCLHSLPAQNANITFRSKLTFPNQHLSNIWGYTAGGLEYALVGGADGLIVVNVTDPENPVQITQIPGPSSSWREIKTYSHYAYVVTEGGGGLQIVDLANLPGTNLTYHSYTGNGAINGQLFSVHALHVDETKGFLYLYGTNLFSGKPVVLNLAPDPYNPIYAGNFNGVGYAHDGYVDNDIMYSAHIFVGQFAIVDMSNKSNPVLLATQNTPTNFTHNTWLSGSTLFTTDENTNSYLSSYNVGNPANITLLDKIQITPGSGSVVHNTHIINDYAVTSWYKDGFAIIDVSRPSNMVQVGRYDTYPGGAGFGYEGCWGVYPYFPSGTIVASNIRALGTDNGEMWVLTPTYLRGCYVEGTVSDASTGFPLTGAKVELLGTPTSENTGALGTYKMGQWQNGAYTARASKAGYVTQNIPVNLDNGMVTALNVALAPVSLPVELLRFEAIAEGHGALLSWETATENDNAGFHVEQSADDGRSWQTLGFVPARGNNAGASDYEYRVADLSAGTYYFRLRQQDNDGTYNYSPWRSVTVGTGSISLDVRPNPLTGQGAVWIQIEKAARISVEVWDALGRPVLSLFDAEVQRETNVPLAMGELPAGTYYLFVYTDRDRLVRKIIKSE